MKPIHKIFIFLAYTATLGQVYSDLYLPSIPFISSSFFTSIHLVEFSVTIYMIGYGISALIYGVISDSIGRKTPLLIGISLCLTGSLICLFSSNIYIFLLGRLVQGLGGGAGFTVTYAIVRDYLVGKKMAVQNSKLSMINIFVIISAPFLGGYIQKYFDWRFNFVFLSIYAIVGLYLICFFQETKDYGTRLKINLKNITKSAAIILSSGEYLTYILCVLAAYAGLLAWLTGGPDLVQLYLHFQPNTFGGVCFIFGLCTVCGVIVNKKLVVKFGINRMMLSGGSIMLLSSISLLVFSFFISKYFTLYFIGIFMFGIAFVLPNGVAGALSKFKENSGMAMSILAGVQISGGVVASFIVSILPTQSYLPLAILFSIFSLTVIFLLINRQKEINE